MLSTFYVPQRSSQHTFRSRLPTQANPPSIRNLHLQHIPPMSIPRILVLVRNPPVGLRYPHHHIARVRLIPIPLLIRLPRPLFMHLHHYLLYPLKALAWRRLHHLDTRFAGGAQVCNRKCVLEPSGSGQLMQNVGTETVKRRTHACKMVSMWVAKAI